MSYYESKQISGNMKEVETKVRNALQEQGFGVLTEINVTETFKKKLNVDFRPYKILGACNPKFAYQALQKEPWIGTMLPCNVVIQEMEPGEISVAAVDPVSSMSSVANPELENIAFEVKHALGQLIKSL